MEFTIISEIEQEIRTMMKKVVNFTSNISGSRSSV